MVLTLKTIKVKQQLDIKTWLLTTSTIEQFSVSVLVNSGYMNFYISQIFIERERINIQKFKSSIPYYNVDGSQNRAETIMELKLNIKNHSELIVVELEKIILFLGYDWLQKYNLVINWSKLLLLLEKYHFHCERILWKEKLEEIEKNLDE